MKKTTTIYNWDQVPIVINLPYVAVILKANPEVVRRYLASGKLKGFKVGREWRVSKKELMAFVGEDVSHEEDEEDNELWMYP